MVQLADHTQTPERTRATSTSGPADQPLGGEGPLGPLPPGFERAARPAQASAPGTSLLLKGSQPMTHSQIDDSARATDTYLLFAHEAYYPDSGTQEINTTVVAADSLLRPRYASPTAPGSTTASPGDASRARSIRCPPSPMN